MRTRIWEDAAAMNIVSVLGFIMNDDGDVVGPERTQVLCKLMPSIHTLTHRAILAMLIVGLNDADTQTFYAEKGLRVLNEWLLEGIKKPAPTASAREKQRIEMYSQVRALLRVMDVNMTTDERRQQNAFLNDTIVKVIEFLGDNTTPDFAPEWSRLNIFRRHFESACGQPTSVKESRAEARYVTAARANEVRSAAKGGPASSASASSTSSTTAASSAPAAPKISPGSLLDYQPKSFLQQKDAGDKDDDMDELLEDDEEMLGEEGVITNVTQSTLSASLDAKIRANGHVMQYGERMHCRLCRRMTAKRCEKCNSCVKCAQKAAPCNPAALPPGGSHVVPPAGGLSVSARNVQVLGSAMDQAIFKAFKNEDFHSLFSLISNGMDVNFQRVESDHSTALMAAAHRGREDAATKLLSLGANPCLVDQNGAAAWAFAKRRGHTELAEKLKKAADEWKS